MPTSAAMLVVAQRHYDLANTFAARHYWLGMRDAFDAVYRACHEKQYGVEVGVDSVADALAFIETRVDEEDRGDLLDEVDRVLHARREATREVNCGLQVVKVPG